jgi:hypothetical protein
MAVARGKIILILDGALKILQCPWPLHAPTLRRAFVEDPDLLSILLQYVRGGIDHESLDVLLPVGVAIEEHLLEVEVINASGGIGEGDLLLCEVKIVAQRLDSLAAKL